MTLNSLNFATTLSIDSRPPVHGVAPYTYLIETEKERLSAFFFGGGGGGSPPLEMSSQTPGADALSSTIEAEASWSFEKASLCFGICLDFRSGFREFRVDYALHCCLRA